MKKLLLIVVVIICTVVSCSKGGDSSGTTNTGGGGTTNNNNNNTCTGTKSFANDVSTIIQTVCAVSGCHDASSTNGVGPLTNYQLVFKSRTNIRSAVSSGTMPKTGSLSADQKNAIICWIDQGAKDN
jgi:hypothetical protein